MGDLEVALDHSESPLDIGQCFVALDDALGLEVSDVGEQHQPAFKRLCLCNASSSTLTAKRTLSSSGATKRLKCSS